MSDREHKLVQNWCQVPHNRHSVILVWQHLDPDLSIRTDVIDRLQTLTFSQAEEWPLHRLALIAERQVCNNRNKEVELPVSGPLFGHFSTVLT